MDATAKTFRYLDQDEVAAQRKAAAGSKEEMTRMNAAHGSLAGPVAQRLRLVRSRTSCSSG